MVKKLPRQECAGRKQTTADSEDDPAFACDPQHHDEQGEEQERRSQIALQDHHAERTRPRGTDRCKVAKLEPSSEQISRVDQVCGEKRSKREFGKLARLKIDRPDTGPDAGSVDLASKPRHQRKDQ